MRCLIPLFLLAACGAEPVPTNTAEVAVAPPATATAKDAEPDDRIPCALPESPAMARVCTIEVAQDDEGTILTLRQPDGGFHRLRRIDGGLTVIAADGAQDPEVRPVSDGIVEVAIGDARYQIPAQ